RDSLFGIVPEYEDLNWEGLAFAPADFDRITQIDSAVWREELDSHAQWFRQLGSPLPEALLSVHVRLGAALAEPN
ncbi:MAG TPA: phosphoenolpyruvate carboxykinase domain-containing protein, partial [Burkholderiaceae bacterium]|nr:phosphoenolpyruvate carboxykinase domain-containing protein [Burkholderiaceae bacterium]